MIYGANGYTGSLIAREAKTRDLRPILAGRNDDKIAPLALELGLQRRAFPLTSAEETARHLKDVDLVLNCAGPFSATSSPLIEACLRARTHYLDITGEITVFENAFQQHSSAHERGIIICPGVGFDVIPTDCLAARLKEVMPDATHLALGFDSRSGFSPGTAKTSVEGMAEGGKIRANGKIQRVPLAFKTRRINFGDGEKLAMSIPWGDISTAYRTTGIPNVEVYIPGSPNVVAKAKRLNSVRFLLKIPWIQNALKKKIESSVYGPSPEIREATPSYVWGEVTNSKGEKKTARVRTANGYSLTVTGALAVVDFLFHQTPPPGVYTPSRLAGSDLVTRLPGSGPITIE